MRFFKVALSTASLMLFFGITFAAVYPEDIWLDTELSIEPVSTLGLDFNVTPKLLQPELYQASAIKKPMCTLGGTMDCMLY